MLALILILHFVLGAAIVAAGDRLNRRGFAVAALAPLTTLIWLVPRLGDLIAGGDGGPAFTQRIDWVAGLDLTIDLRVDAFAAVMLLLVSGIGLAVCMYALGYFSSPKPGVARLAGLLTMFAGAMTGLVTSDHLLALFVFWELTSVTSYALIGNDDRNPKARDAALQAILITGAGGLVMLAGLVILGQTVGTYRLSEMATVFAEQKPSGALLTVAVVLVLVGAFTKSAQWPFSGWLPGAMVAPTPISTYLHAATMVKAGVYLVARLAPIVYPLAVWRPVLFAVGAVTMIFGGWRALRQVDLKVLLAHGTVSQLGFLMMVFGAGTYDLAQAAVILILGHGAFKAALFMVVGVIDHQAHTRDIRRIASLGPGWRAVQVTAVLAAASMAGLPPLVGFIGKEKALLAAADGYLASVTGGAWVVTAAIVVGSVVTFAYSGRFVLGVLGRMTDRSVVDADHPLIDGDAPAPSLGFVAPGAVLAGEYAGAKTAHAAEAKIDLLVDHGVRPFIDLTQPVGVLAPYVDHVERIGVRAAVDRGEHVDVAAGRPVRVVDGDPVLPQQSRGVRSGADLEAAVEVDRAAEIPRGRQAREGGRRPLPPPDRAGAVRQRDARLPRRRPRRGHDGA